MTSSERPARPEIVFSDQQAPSLAFQMGVDREDVGEWMFEDYEFDGDPVVLASLSWDISEQKGWSSPAGGETGNVHLAVYDSQYWAVVESEGEREANTIQAGTDEEALERFLRGYGDGNEDVVTVYRRGEAKRQ